MQKKHKKRINNNKLTYSHKHNSRKNNTKQTLCQSTVFEVRLFSWLGAGEALGGVGRRVFYIYSPLEIILLLFFRIHSTR